MENFKKFLSKYGAAIVFGAAFILFLGFFALPLVNYELTQTIGDAENTFLQSVRGYELLTTSNIKILGVTMEVIQNKFVVAAFSITIIAYLLALFVWASKITGVLKNEKVTKSLFGTALGLTLVSLVMFFALEKIANAWPYAIYPDAAAFEGEVELEAKFNDVGSVFVIISLFAMCLCLVRELMNQAKFNTKEIVEFGVLIALAVILDKLPIFDLTVGAGSVNLSGIPLMILALRHGPFKGFFCSSVVFGIMTCLIDGYGVQTFPFDYFIAFAGYALAGFAYQMFSKYILKSDKDGIKVANIVIAFIFGGIGIFVTRMIGSTISSMVLYDYEFNAAFMYNIMYVGPSAGFVTAICIALAYPINLINKLFPVEKTQEIKEEVLDEAK